VRVLPAFPGVAAYGGTKYVVLTAVDIETGQTITFTPVDTVVTDTYYQRITEVDCGGTTSTRWVNDAGAIVAAPDPAQIVECSVQTTPGALLPGCRRRRPCGPPARPRLRSAPRPAARLPSNARSCR
jgi:hypothetical protein